MELHEKIAAMREYITEHGFCKWELQDTQGRVCIVGADVKTSSHFGYYEGTEVGTFLANLAIELGLVEPYTTLDHPVMGGTVYPPSDANIAFNNHPDTTENDIIEFLRTAEVKAKELGNAR